MEPDAGGDEMTGLEREALGEVLFDFVYLYETLGIPIEEIMDATEGGME